MANVTERLIAEIVAAGNVADGTAERRVDDYADAAVRAGTASKRFGDGQRRVAQDSDAATESIGKLVKKIGAAAAAYLTVGSAIRGGTGAVQAFAVFEAGLVGVGKTADIQGAALQSLGRDIEALAGRIPAGTSELLSIAQAAGQLGVKGTSAILAFTETVAQMGSASDLSGEEAATALARILNVTGESAESVGTLASVVVALGNSFAATESQIARHTGEVARATSVYEIGSAQSAALATTLAAFGVQAELSGSAVGRSFRVIESAVKEGGEELAKLDAIAVGTADDLVDAFGRNATEAFGLLLQGLRETINEGGNVAKQLATVGLKGEEILKVLPVLAKEYDTLASAQAIAARETQGGTALTAEAQKAYATLSSQLAIVGNDLQRTARIAGAEIAPNVALAAEKVRELLADNDELVASLGKLAGISLDGVVGGVGFLVDNMELLAVVAGTAALVKLPALITAITTQVAALNAVLLANPLVAVAAGAAALGAILNSVVLKVIRETTAEIDQMTASANRFRDQIRSWGAAIDGSDVGALRDSLAEAREESTKVAAELDKARDKYAQLTAKIEKTTFAGDLIEKREALNRSIRDLESQQTTLNAKIAQMEVVLPMTEAMAGAFADVAPEVEGVGDELKEIPKAVKAVTDELAGLEEQARFMREFGLSAEEAGDAVRLKFAEGVSMADAAIAALIQKLQAGRDELEFLTLLAKTAPGQLEQRDFGGFGKVGEEAPGGDFTAFERAAQITAQMATDEERRLKAVIEAKKLREAGLITEETYQRVLAANADTFEVLNDEAEEHLVLWERIAIAAIQGAQDAEGAWGNVLRFIGENVAGIAAGFDQLANIASTRGDTRNAQLLGGASALFQGDYGGAIAGFAQGLGLTGGGYSPLGGREEGNFIAEGAQLGAQFGGAYGAIIGAAVGAFVKSGADDMHSHLEEAAGRADLVVTQAEGGLAELAQQVEQTLEEFFNNLQESLVADLDFEAAGLEFHVREDRIRVVVNGLQVVFKTVEEAIAFAAQGVLAANAEADGLGENMRALFTAMAGPDVVGSLEELQAAIGLASALDFEEVGVTGELTRHRQELIALGTRYGLSLEAIIAMEDKRIASMKRALEAEIASVFGVDDVAGRFRSLTGAVTQFDAELAHEQEARQRRLDTLEAEIATMEEARESMGGFAGEAAGVGEATEETGGILRRLRGEGRRTGEGMRGVADDMADVASEATAAGREFRATNQSINAMREEAEALRESLDAGTEAFGAEEVGKLWTTAADQVAVSLIQMIQAIRGESANVQELEEIRERQFLFTLAAQIQQAQIVLATMEFVSEAVRAMLEELVADGLELLEGLASGEIEFPDASDVGRGGGRQRREALADARRDFRETVEDMTALLGGATDQTLALAQAQADLAEKGREAKLSVEEIAAAVAMLAELQVAEITDPFRETAQRRRESGTATAMREAQEAAAAATAEALVASGGDPELYREAARAITQGLNAELAAIGEEGLAGIGGARAALRLEHRETIREIDFLRENAEALGLSLRQISNAVRDNVLPDLFGILERQAERVGDEEALVLIQERRAKFELRLEQLKFELLVKQLEAADAITPALQGWIDMGREFFELPTAVGPGPGGGGEGAVLRLETTLGGGGVGRSSQAATSQAQALARALDAVARQTEEWLDAGIDPFQDRLNDLTDRFTDLAAAVLSAGGSLRDVIELEEALAVARQDLLDNLLSGVEERLRAAELEAPGALPAERLATLQGAFAEAIAAAQAAPGEETFADAFELFDMLQAFAGESFTGGTLAAFLAQLNAQLGTLGDLTLEDLELPTQEELLAEISGKLSDSAGVGIGTSIGGVKTAVQEIEIPGLSQEVLDSVTAAIGAVQTAEFVATFGPDALATLSDSINALDVDFSTINFDGLVTALGGPDSALGQMALALGPEGIQALIGTTNTNTGNTASNTDDIADVETNTRNTETALTSEADSRISGKLSKLNNTIGVTGRPLKSLVYDILVGVNAIAGRSAGGESFARTSATAPTTPSFDELLVLNTAAIQGNTSAAEANTVELRSLSAAVGDLQRSMDRMRPLAGGR